LTLRTKENSSKLKPDLNDGSLSTLEIHPSLLLLEGNQVTDLTTQKDSNVSMTLSEDQRQAFDKMTAWMRGEYQKGENLSLGGYAGTGKTTLLKLLMDDTDLFVHVMSLTGKACSVLVKKGVDAQTIHSSIYHVHIDKKKPVFTLRSHIEDTPDLLIIDEASMVSTEVYRDLLSFSTPILWVGDHGQLEPVGRNPGIMKNPDIRLEKIHRQAEGNPIIMFADRIRKGAIPQAIASTKDEQVKVISKVRANVHLTEVDQIIVAMNRTRVRINKAIRQSQDKTTNYPVIGDKVLCLKNKRSESLFNGLQGVIQGITIDPSWPIARVSIELETSRVWEGEILLEQFNHIKGLIEPDKALWRATHWDYAYAITCHKAQGSEWPRVLVLEEKCPLWEMPRWRYTAVTRAAEELIYAC